MKLKILALTAVAFACFAPLHAQVTPPASPTISATAPAISPDKEKAIRHLLELTGAVKNAQQSMDLAFSQMRENAEASGTQLPETFWTKIHAKMNPAELIELLIPVWAKHYTAQELSDLVAFYESPLGQKVTAETPAMNQESQLVGMKWGQQRAAEVINEISQQAKPAKKPSRAVTPPKQKPQR